MVTRPKVTVPRNKRRSRGEGTSSPGVRRTLALKDRSRRHPLEGRESGPNVARRRPSTWGRQTLSRLVGPCFLVVVRGPSETTPITPQEAFQCPSDKINKSLTGRNTSPYARVCVRRTCDETLLSQTKNGEVVFVTVELLIPVLDFPSVEGGVSSFFSGPYKDNFPNSHVG